MFPKKILILNHSYRGEEGNAGTIAEFIKEKYQLTCEVSVLNLSETNIRGCSGCKYECFKGDNCPKSKDDMTDFYIQSMMLKDYVIQIFPVYCGNLPLTYYALNERTQQHTFEEEFAPLWNERNLVDIVITNTDQELIEKVLRNEEPLRDILFASNHEYGLKSIDGQIMTSKRFEKHLESFLEKVIRVEKPS